MMSDRALGIAAIIFAFGIIIATIAGAWHRSDAVVAYLMDAPIK